MRQVPVESSCIDSVGYENEVLEVRFNDGGVYRYFEVPAQLYRQLLAAESKGRFFNVHVRDDYGYVQVARKKSAFQRAS
jgi:KTSC domain